MAIDYATALSRVRSWVMDSGSLIWTDADLQGGIRLALQEINLASGQAYTLNGLDGAVTTTLPVKLEGVLVLGGAGFAATARTLDRAESYELANEGSDVKGWAEKTLSRFSSLLSKLYPSDQARTASQKAAASGPWKAWADDFGEKGANE